MLEVDIPGRGALELEHLVLDVNGTIALDGAPLEGVAEALESLRGTLEAVIVSADTHGTAEELARTLGVRLHVISAGHEVGQKAAVVRELGADSVVAVGNGANDAAMLSGAALGIVVIGPEGASAEAFAAADIVVGDPLSALGLLQEPRRLVATLRR